MGAAAAGGAVVGGSQLLAAKQQADAVKAQGKWQAQQLNFNATVAGMQRREIDVKAQDDISMRQKDIARMLGDQKAMIAANGIDVDSDVSKQIEADTRRTGREDVSNIKNNAWREAWGLQVKESDLRSQANFARSSGKIGAANTLLAGGLSAIGTAASYGVKDYSPGGSKPAPKTDSGYSGSTSTTKYYRSGSNSNVS